MTPTLLKSNIVHEAATMSVKTLSARYGMKPTAIRYILRGAGVKPFHDGGILCKDRLEEMIEVAGPLTLAQMADRLDTNMSRVAKSLRHHGLTTGRKRHVRNRLREPRPFIHVLAEVINNTGPEDESMTKMAKRHNVTREYISQVIAECRQAGLLN